eukprot:4102307-Pleurochrysis_carterae.AAC.1
MTELCYGDTACREVQNSAHSRYLERQNTKRSRVFLQEPMTVSVLKTVSNNASASCKKEKRTRPREVAQHLEDLE